MSNSAAYRQVAVNRKTGTRWRYGRSIPGVGGGTLHYPPVLSPRSTTSARYLFKDERVTIADLHRTGLSSRAIAEHVRRSPSTISRELARRLQADPVLRRFVQQCMDVRWSPEQISHALTVEFPDQPGGQLVPTSHVRRVIRRHGGRPIVSG